MFEHFQIEIKFSKLRNFEEYKMFDKEYKFSFEMFWKKNSWIMVFRKVNWIFHIEMDSLKVLKG